MIDKAGSGVLREDYYRGVIEDAARRLRQDNIGHIVATDLEDSLRWSYDPHICAHPYWNCRQDGTTYCRTCQVDTSDIDPMGN